MRTPQDVCTPDLSGDFQLFGENPSFFHRSRTLSLPFQNELFAQLKMNGLRRVAHRVRSFRTTAPRGRKTVTLFTSRAGGDSNEIRGWVRSLIRETSGTLENKAPFRGFEGNPESLLDERREEGRTETNAVFLCDDPSRVFSAASYLLQFSAAPRTCPQLLVSTSRTHSRLAVARQFGNSLMRRQIRSCTRQTYTQTRTRCVTDASASSCTHKRTKIASAETAASITDDGNRCDADSRSAGSL